MAFPAALNNHESSQSPNHCSFQKQLKHEAASRVKNNQSFDGTKLVN